MRIAVVDVSVSPPTFDLSSSAPAGSVGALHGIPAGAKSMTLHGIPAGAKSMTFLLGGHSGRPSVHDGSKKCIWGLSEGLSQRYLFSVDATKHP